MKKKDAVKVVFDRKNVSAKKGTGKVEICIYLSRLQRKFITIGKSTPLEWKKVAKRKDVVSEVEKFEKVVEAMQMLGEDMTIENFDAHLNFGKKAKEEKKAKEILKVTEEPEEENNTFNGFDLTESFTEYMRKNIEEEHIEENTRTRKRQVPTQREPHRCHRVLVPQAFEVLHQPG